MLILPIVIMVMPEGDDRDYMEQLYRDYHRLMFSTAWRYSREKAVVEDIVSDSCVALIKKIPTLRELEENKLKAYIITTVKNTALNCFDKQKRSINYTFSDDGKILDSIADAFDMEKKIALADELACVWRAIRQLPEKEQQVMYMKYALEMPDEKIAEKIGLSVNSIRKYVSRAREHIKKTVYTE